MFGREAFYYQQAEMYFCVMYQENILHTANAGKSHIIQDKKLNQCALLHPLSKRSVAISY